MSMKAVEYQEPFKLKVKEVPKPKIEHPDAVIVKITTTAICGSDLHMYVSGTLPLIKREVLTTLGGTDISGERTNFRA